MTDTTIATTDEMLTAVERWARAAGQLYETRSGSLWRMVRDMCDGKVMIRLHAPLADSKGPWLGYDVGPPVAVWEVDPATALAWALCVDAGVTVDVGRCPACEARGCGPGRKLAMFEWAVEQAAIGLVELAVPETWRPKCGGWTYGEVVWRRQRVPTYWRSDASMYPRSTSSVADVDVRVCTRPCPTCNADHDYRHHVEAACLVLDAAPQPTSCDGGLCWGSNAPEPGDPKAREALGPFADERQAEGNPLGTTLASWLGLWTAGDLRETRAAVDALTAAWERLTVPCGRCEGAGKVTRMVRGGVPIREVPGSNAVGAGETLTFDCPKCDGHGRVPPPPDVSPFKLADGASVRAGDAVYLREDGTVGRAQPVDQSQTNALMSRLLEVAGRDMVVEVDRFDLEGRRRITVHRPGALSPVDLASVVNDTRDGAVPIEVFSFDVVDVFVDGEIRSFAVPEGTPEEHALSLIQRECERPQTVPPARRRG